MHTSSNKAYSDYTLQRICSEVRFKTFLMEGTQEILFKHTCYYALWRTEGLFNDFIFKGFDFYESVQSPWHKDRASLVNYLYTVEITICKTTSFWPSFATVWGILIFSYGWIEKINQIEQDCNMCGRPMIGQLSYKAWLIKELENPISSVWGGNLILSRVTGQEREWSRITFNWAAGVGQE
jgi:hypothetical protein